jgi:hypothetical protein
MYCSLPNLIIGFHGCDKAVYEQILYEHKPFRASQNNYDWLGHGMYFWEQNLERAWEWAKCGLTNPKHHIKTPAVLGAIINLGHCLNLLDSHSIQTLKNQYEIFSEEMKLAGKTLPKNADIKGGDGLLLRYLDCAVIESLHQERETQKERAFDSVRGVFFEGSKIYETSGFMEQSHIQICVRNPNCIKAFFAPKQVDAKWSIL